MDAVLRLFGVLVILAGAAAVASDLPDLSIPAIITGSAALVSGLLLLAFAAVIDLLRDIRDAAKRD